MYVTIVIRVTKNVHTYICLLRKHLSMEESLMVNCFSWRKVYIKITLHMCVGIVLLGTDIEIKIEKLIF